MELFWMGMMIGYWIMTEVMFLALDIGSNRDG